MIDFKAVFDMLPANGWLTEDEARLLWNSVRLTDGPILEVGSYHGRSTCLLASLDRPVYSVDPFSNFSTEDPGGDATYRSLLDNLYSRGLSDHVAVFRMRIEEWDPLPCGFAYLDGDHTYDGSLQQINAALLCGVGRLCIHDYCNDGQGAEVARAASDCRRLKLLDRVGRMADFKVYGEASCR